MDVVQGHNMAPVIPINPNTVETGVSTTKSPPGTLLNAPRQKRMRHTDGWIRHSNMPLISPNRSSSLHKNRITIETIVGLPP